MVDIFDSPDVQRAVADVQYSTVQYSAAAVVNKGPKLVAVVSSSRQNSAV